VKSAKPKKKFEKFHKFDTDGTISRNPGAERRGGVPRAAVGFPDRVDNRPTPACVGRGSLVPSGRGGVASGRPYSSWSIWLPGPGRCPADACLRRSSETGTLIGLGLRTFFDIFLGIADLRNFTGLLARRAGVGQRTISREFLA